MRGAVTLAAVFLLPEDTPHREVIVLIALVVAAGTLLIQGSTLPLVVRILKLRGPDPAQDMLVEARLYQQAANAGLARLDLELTGDEPAQVVDRLRNHGLERANAAWETLGGLNETPSEIYARLRSKMLEVERATVLRARNDHSAPDEVLRRVLESLDIEETVLLRAERSDTSERAVELVPHQFNELCPELQEALAEELPPPLTPQGCEECLALGYTWVHLRICVACGHVGCCDSSPHRHATNHFRQTAHPVIQSFEPGEAWRWCYIHDVTG